MKTLLGALAMLALFLGWNAPNHYPPWPAAHLEMVAAAALLLLAAVALPPAAPGGAGSVLRAPRAVWWWMLPAALPPLQYAAGLVVFRGDAWLGLLYGLAVPLGLYIGLLWARRLGRDRALQLLWVTLLAAGLVAAGLALAQWLRLPPSGWWAMELIGPRPFANFGQPNHLGLAMVMAAVAAAALFEQHAIEHRTLHHAAQAVLMLGLMASQSRAALLALGVVAGLALMRRGPVRLARLDIAIAGSLAVLAFAACGALGGVLQLSGPAGRALGEGDGGRLEIWRHFMAAIAQHPWRGYGFNQSVAALADVAAEVAPSRNVTYAHNVLLDLFTWFGVPLGLLLSVAMAGWLWRLLRAPTDRAGQLQRQAVFAVWLTLVLGSMLEYPYAHAYFIVPAALLAGALGAEAGAVPGVRPSPSMQLGLGLAAAMLLATAVDYFRLEDAFRQNRFARAALLGAPPVVTPEPWVLDQLAALNATAALAPRRGMTDAELEQLHRVARRFHILGNRLDYARALALNGRLDDAEREIVVMRSLQPDATALQKNWRRWLEDNGVRPR